MPRTALIVAVPEAEPIVGEWRAEYDSSAQRGVPAHITLLVPFVTTDRMDERLLHDLRELFASQPAFTFQLPRVARFPAVAWLAPDPAEPFKELIERIVSRYPDYPPYEGIHDEVIPHLTVAEGGPELQAAVEAALEPHLPVQAEAHEVELILEDEFGNWHGGASFKLGR